MPDFAPKANLSDPAKIELDIEQKRKAFFSEAALSAFSGQIAMVNLKVSSLGEDCLAFSLSVELDLGRIAQVGLRREVRHPLLENFVRQGDGFKVADYVAH